jgi:hypothetical protein
MGIGSGDDISAIASLNNKFFHTHFFEDWSDSEFDDDADLMVVDEVLTRQCPCLGAFDSWRELGR